MHILHINKYRHIRGGVDKHFLDLTKLLRSQGHTVTLFTLNTSQDSYIEYAEMLPFGLTSEELPNATFKMKLRGALSSIYSFNNAQLLKRLISIVHPDIAHLHNIYYQLSGSIIPILKQNGIPIVQSVHDFQWFCPAGTFFHEGEVCDECVTRGLRSVLRRRCYRKPFSPNLMAYLSHVVERWLRLRERIDRFIAPSMFVRDMLAQLGIPQDKIILVYNFLPDLSDKITFYPKSKPGKFVLYMGRLVSEKGIKLLVEIAEKMPQIPIHFAGSGELLTWLKDRAKGMPNIHVLGQLDGADLVSEIDSARVIMLPTQCYDTAPLVILESYARGKPVIVSGSGGIPELVKHGETGYIISNGQLSSYCDAINDIFLNDEKALEMGINGYHYVKACHTPQNYINKLEIIYRSLFSFSK